VPTNGFVAETWNYDCWELTKKKLCAKICPKTVEALCMDMCPSA
jgi:hypothetical protein